MWVYKSKPLKFVHQNDILVAKSSKTRNNDDPQKSLQAAEISVHC